jgi:activator of HSP90 ATPase
MKQYLEDIEQSFDPKYVFMTKTIVQYVLFENCKAETLYQIYTDSKKHSIATGAPAELSTKEGGNYSAHNGFITGKNLQLIENRLIVQSWRAQSWKPTDIDSTFIIHLEQEGDDVLLHAVHANVPENAFEALDAGWHKMYWQPWKLYLAGTPIKRASM